MDSSPPFPTIGGDLSCKGWIAVDCDSGEVVGGSGEDELLPIASVSKVMTALCVVDVIERLKGSGRGGGRPTFDSRCYVSRRAARMPGTSAGLTEGDELSVTDLLYGMLLPSGNDAATALAEFFDGFCLELLRRDGGARSRSASANSRDEGKCGDDPDRLFPDSLSSVDAAAPAAPAVLRDAKGRVAGPPPAGGGAPRSAVAHFVRYMNRLARFLGLDRTMFANPHGMSRSSGEDGYEVSTARNVSVMCRALMAQDRLKRIVRARSYTYRSRMKRTGGHSWQNTNMLLSPAARLAQVDDELVRGRGGSSSGGDAAGRSGTSGSSGNYCSTTSGRSSPRGGRRLRSPRSLKSVHGSSSSRSSGGGGGKAMPGRRGGAGKRAGKAKVKSRRPRLGSDRTTTTTTMDEPRPDSEPRPGSEPASETPGPIYVVDGLKTGITLRAGGCLATSSSCVEDDDLFGRRLIVVTLGSYSKMMRFVDNQRVIDWAWHKVWARHHQPHSERLEGEGEEEEEEAEYGGRGTVRTHDDRALETRVSVSSGSSRTERESTPSPEPATPSSSASTSSSSSSSSSSPWGGGGGGSGGERRRRPQSAHAAGRKQPAAAGVPAAAMFARAPSPRWC